jgi:hypothetical protein
MSALGPRRATQTEGPLGVSGPLFVSPA